MKSKEQVWESLDHATGEQKRLKHELDEMQAGGVPTDSKYYQRRFETYREWKAREETLLWVLGE